MARAFKPRKRAFTMPDPGALAHLGSLVEMLVRRPDGTEELHEWADGKLDWFWSPSQRALIGKPTRERAYVDMEQRPGGASGFRDAHLDQPEPYRRGAARPKAGERQTREAAALFRRWAARPATRYCDEEWPAYTLKPYASLIHHKYRSDKWNGRGGEETLYIHHAPKTGSNQVSIAEGPDGPALIWVQGPALTVTERGIIW